MDKQAFENLFTTWKGDKQELFVRDGIIDFEQYNKTQPKILFVLKDAHLQKEDGVLLQQLHDGGHPRAITWIRATKWVNGIYSLYDSGNKVIKPYRDILDEYTQSKKTFKQNELRKIALVNLNKDGSNTVQTNDKNLRENTERDKEYIRKEVELCNPDIIIFGGVYDLYWDKVEPDTTFKDNLTKAFKDVTIKKDSKNRIVVETYHPQAIKKGLTLESWYNQILGAIQYINSR